MQVILVNGSPHPHGCTYTALDEVARTLNAEGIETEMFQVGDQAARRVPGLRALPDRRALRVRRPGQRVRRSRPGGRRVRVRLAGALCRRGRRHDVLHGPRLLLEHDAGGSAFTSSRRACVVSARRAGTTAAFDQINKYLTISEMLVVGFALLEHGARQHARTRCGRTWRGCRSCAPWRGTWPGCSSAKRPASRPGSPSRSARRACRRTLSAEATTAGGAHRRAAAHSAMSGLSARGIRSDHRTPGERVHRGEESLPGVAANYMTTPYLCQSGQSQGDDRPLSLTGPACRNALARSGTVPVGTGRSEAGSIPRLLSFMFDYILLLSSMERMPPSQAARRVCHTNTLCIRAWTCTRRRFSLRYGMLRASAPCFTLGRSISHSPENG